MTEPVDVVALIRKAAVAAVNAQAEAAQEATRDLAPKDTGALVESIVVHKATARSKVAQLYTNAEHALYQHEALDLVHPTGQAKYMENAINAEKAAIDAAGVAAARRIFDQG